MHYVHKNIFILNITTILSPESSLLSVGECSTWNKGEKRGDPDKLPLHSTPQGSTHFNTVYLFSYKCLVSFITISNRINSNTIGHKVLFASTQVLLYAYTTNVIFRLSLLISIRDTEELAIRGFDNFERINKVIHIC
jgi:hypothetical protein